MDYALIGLTNTFFFPDDIIIVSKCSEENHVKLVKDYLQQLDAGNLRINLPRCHFAQPEILWLTYNISQSGISPLESKTSVNVALKQPNALTGIRSFLGSIHYISNFIHTLAQLCNPSRPLLRKSINYIWTEEHTIKFNAVKTRIANHTESFYYNH